MAQQRQVILLRRLAQSHQRQRALKMTTFFLTMTEHLRMRKMLCFLMLQCRRPQRRVYSWIQVQYQQVPALPNPKPWERLLLLPQDKMQLMQMRITRQHQAQVITTRIEQKMYKVICLQACILSAARFQEHTAEQAMRGVCSQVSQARHVGHKRLCKQCESAR
ncbi:unnamed protein product [Amoebophrya sp. A25]|nr:unnamed protein product [Amoebophrya sp. A25]|eukprot:GSA25T00004467001.1